MKKKIYVKKMLLSPRPECMRENVEKHYFKLKCPKK